MANNFKRNPNNPASTLFKKLTRLLSGPLVNYRRQSERNVRRRNLKKYDFMSVHGQSFKRTDYDPFQHLRTDIMMKQNRAVRYSEFEQMEFDPILSSALDVYSDEITTSSDLQPLLKIACPNQEIQTELDILYNTILNIEFNLFGWSRSLCKYGDLFLYLDIDEKIGVKNVIPLPVAEMERLEGEDKMNPNYTQFHWNAGGLTFENWQVGHFRILGNDKYQPNGTSVLDPARRVFRQIDLLENAMMAYRVSRGPERRVFYFDVGSIPPQEVEQYMQKMITSMKRNQVVDPDTGKVDLRFNPSCNFPNDFIYLCDGSRKTFKEFSEEWLSKKKDYYVWSLDEEKNVVPTKLLWVGKTKEKTKFLEIWLDDGQVIRTTPEHKWILRNGENIEAKDLKINDSLMPFYIKIDKAKTQRYCRYSKDNFYTKTYQPGKKRYETTHKIVSVWKYGEYSFPDVIHHKDHCKYNNEPNNLEKMNNVEHSQLHMKIAKENISGLIEYAKSDEGRSVSRETILKTRQKYDFSEIMKDIWKRDGYKQKLKEKLSLKIDSTLILFLGQALEKLGTSAKEYEVRQWLNNNKIFEEYLYSLNRDFKNGFNNKLTKMQLLGCIRKNNFNGLTDFKDFYISIKCSWNKVIDFVNNNKISTRKQVYEYFNISRYDFVRLIRFHGLTPKEFDKIYLNNGYYCGDYYQSYCKGCNSVIYHNNRSTKKIFCNHKCYSNWMKGKSQVNKNHKVVLIKEYEYLEDAYAATVENTSHTIAIGGSNASLLENTTYESGIFINQSIAEDFFIPVRGNTQTRIETLPGGQFSGDMDDIKYLKDKLFSAIKIPQEYLFRGEGADSDKTSLSAKDLRFARTIQRIQRSIISELEKIGIIHLYTLGYRKSDLVSFKLSLNNPSKIAELQELEAWRTKFDVASAATEGFFSRRWIGKKLFGLSDEEMVRNQKEMYFDRYFDAQLDEIVEGPSVGGGAGGSGESPLDDLGGGGDSGSDSESGGEESTLLASPDTSDSSSPEPGKRDEPYLTQGAKGKLYYPVLSDKRDMGARKRSYRSKYNDESGRNTARNIHKGYSGLATFAKGIYEEKENVEQNNKTIYNEETDILRTSHEINILIEDLEKVGDVKRKVLTEKEEKKLLQLVNIEEEKKNVK